MFSPLVWVFGMLLWSFYTGKEELAKKLRISALVLLYICSNSFIVDECFRQWEPVTEDIDLMQTKYEGAIVLGGIGSIDQRLQKINFGWSGDRLFQVLPLYHQQRIQKIIFTGGSGSIEFPENREGFFVEKYLRALHIPDSAMIIENNSRNTYENAIFTKKIVDSLHMKGPFLLVTSAYHMPRSFAIFKKAGFNQIVPYPVNRVSGSRRFTPDHLLMPNPDALFSLQFLIHEWIGYVVYKIKGYA